MHACEAAVYMSPKFSAAMNRLEVNDENEIPDYLGSSGFLSTEMCRIGPPDFIMVTEFTDDVGPVPLEGFVFPQECCSKSSLNDFAVKVMSTDYFANPSGPFRSEFFMPDDVCTFISKSTNNQHTMIYAITLYDVHSRGYVRPLYISYTSSSRRKMLNIYAELKSSLSKVVHPLVHSNFDKFSQDVETLGKTDCDSLDNFDALKQKFICNVKDQVHLKKKFLRERCCCPTQTFPKQIPINDKFDKGERPLKLLCHESVWEDFQTALRELQQRFAYDVTGVACQNIPYPGDVNQTQLYIGNVCISSLSLQHLIGDSKEKSCRYKCESKYVPSAAVHAKLAESEDPLTPIFSSSLKSDSGIYSHQHNRDPTIESLPDSFSSFPPSLRSNSLDSVTGDFDDLTHDWHVLKDHGTDSYKDLSVLISCHRAEVPSLIYSVLIGRPLLIIEQKRHKISAVKVAQVLTDFVPAVKREMAEKDKTQKYNVLKEKFSLRDVLAHPITCLVTSETNVNVTSNLRMFASVFNVSTEEYIGPKYSTKGMLHLFDRKKKHKEPSVFFPLITRFLYLLGCQVQLYYSSLQLLKESEICRLLNLRPASLDLQIVKSLARLVLKHQYVTEIKEVCGSDISSVTVVL